MDPLFAQELCELNNRFYRTWANSFSDTRHNTWPGWNRCLEKSGLAIHLHSLQEQFHLLDVACGNLRFEKHLAHFAPNAAIKVQALDACDELAQNGVQLPSNVSVSFTHCDVMKELQSGTLADVLRFDAQADLSVSFGFLHHIPLPEWRATFLQALIRATKPGGFAFVSLWRFLTDEGLASKAKAITASGIAELGYAKEQFDKGDCLLGWKKETGAYRYCHSFSDEEIGALASAVTNEGRLKARFQADGRTGTLNEYLVFQRTR